MAKYPNEIYEPRPKENRAGVVYDPNKKTVIFVEDIKALDDEVKAIETELGTNPRGNFNSVKEFLQYLLGKVKDYFTDLLDVPHSYQGQGGKFVVVKSTEDGLEFVDPVVTAIISREGAITHFNLTFSAAGSQAIYTPSSGKAAKVIAWSFYSDADVVVEMRFGTSGKVIAGLPAKGANAMNLIGTEAPTGAADETIVIYGGGAVNVKGWVSIVEV